MKQRTLGLAILSAAIMAIPVTSLASSGHVVDFKALYTKVVADLQSCSLCHTTTPALNSYGSDFAANHTGVSKDAFTAIQSLDSDGDSFDNLTEINAGSLPGDFAKTPVVKTDTTGGTMTINLGNGVSITIPDCAAGGGIVINNNTGGNTSTPSTPSNNGASCTNCHSDGRSGSLPSGHPDIGGGTPSTTYTAALCITCHRDGRSGAISNGHPDVSNLASILASNPGRSARDNSAICNTCHSGESGTIPSDHPDLSGKLSGGGGNDDDDDD